MAARSKARKRALDILFEAEARSESALTVLAEREAEGTRAATPLNAYVTELVVGAVDRSGEIDQLIATYATGWSVERMPAVDRNLLRVATLELLLGEVPRAVVLSEAVALAQDLSTDESPQFVNGLLARIAEVVRRPEPGAGCGI